MRILVTFATGYGCTEKCANTLRDKLDGTIVLHNLKNGKRKDLDSFDTIILGGSIRAGRVQRRVKQFCENNRSLLKSKKLGLFLCCMEEGENGWKQFNDAYPADLRDHAAAKGLFGGEFHFEKMDPVTKAIIKKMAKTDENISTLSENNIDSFAKQMK